ncbi:hypothetical protein ALC62_10776 [Cyphomyrmex costatus]|uniref:Regulatory protein zeste n=1 Tax=Cyphomyrmex costatus TaxID=456900 RepID=A0A151IDH3_9HYME|nr:hypothetical protein ALC62_10776 [Cyphomyrmex costatus]
MKVREVPHNSLFTIVYLCASKTITRQTNIFDYPFCLDNNFASLGLFVHIIRFARGFGKMNVTEKQKGILLSFMQRYPDFGRGRLRYNSENKRKIDEFWEKLSIMLNTAACGPRKFCKEWAKVIFIFGNIYYVMNP